MSVVGHVRQRRGVVIIPGRQLTGVAATGITRIGGGAKIQAPDSVGLGC
jgi:hypothetical protein